jgi:hypothetical protein
MDSLLPEENRGDYEDYGSLLNELKRAGFNTQKKVKQLIQKHLKVVIAGDKKRVSDELKSNYEICYEKDDQARVNRGVFYIHAGLVRNALEIETGVKSIADE